MENNQKKTLNHSEIMRKAVQLALKAKFQTDPNPMVGAILTDGAGRIAATGYHAKAGAPHAEAEALANIDQASSDSVLYVTMEPCCNQGRTPPCTETILRKKVRRVVIGCLDPNPKVAGRGVEILKKNGVKVEVGTLEKECSEINRVYNKHITQSLPYVTLKAAASADGKISMASGESQWITDDPARAFAHRLRSRHQAIAVGANTLKVDNPRLTDRISDNPRHPARVVFSGLGEVSMDSHFVKSDISPKIIVVGAGIASSTVDKLKNKGVQVLVDGSKTPSVKRSLRRLHQLGFCSLLLEGGGGLVASFVREKMIDKIYLCLSGKIIGDAKAPGWCGNLGINLLADVPRIKFTKTTAIGQDLLISGYFEN